MDENNLPVTETQPGMQVNLPNIAVLYTDSVLVGINQFGIILDFAQSMGPTNQQTVVARVGMSKEHAKVLLKVLQERLEADEKIEGTSKN